MTARSSKFARTDASTAPGTRVDDFTLAYLISHGMSADLFAVWHHTLRAPLVCKRLRPADERDAKWRAILRAEGAALGQLTHPGIVRLIAQRQEIPLPYLLLEHAGEKSLRDVLIETGAFAIDAAVRIVQHVGGAVAYAHARGFIHRDLKPSNIILRGGRPVLLDFGVAWKYRGGRKPPDRSGTPQYLAPEQIMREPLSPATDIYGLGLLLFELLAGVRPFRTGEVERHDSSAPLSARYPQLSEEPLTLAQAGRRGVPRGMRETIARCLAREPGERFKTVEELLKALDDFTRIKVWPGELVNADSRFSPFD